MTSYLASMNVNIMNLYGNAFVGLLSFLELKSSWSSFTFIKIINILRFIFFWVPRKNNRLMDLKAQHFYFLDNLRKGKENERM